MPLVRAVSAAVISAAALIVAVPISSEANPAKPPTRICIPVSASGVGQDLGGGRTTATISSAGVRLGTSSATFTTTGMNGPVARFAGDIVISTAIGSLTAPVTGRLDVTTGTFTSTSRTVTGSGALRWVSGTLRFHGVENLTSGAFTETITGRLCASRR